MRLTYANVTATLALVVALGGTGAYAAGLAKDSVGSRAIRNGAIRAVDVKPDVLTGAVIDESTLGSVPSADAVEGVDTYSGSAPHTGGLGPVFTNGRVQVNVYCGGGDSLQAELTVAALVDSVVVAEGDEMHVLNADQGMTVATAVDNLTSGGLAHTTFSVHDGENWFTVDGAVYARYFCSARIRVFDGPPTSQLG